LSKKIAVALACLALLGCNAGSPTALAAFNPALIHGRWAITFSSNSCDLSEIQVSFTQFGSGGPIPESIRLVGSWQKSGAPTSADLEGTLARDTGKIILELLADVRILEGIVIDQDNLVFGYSDLSTGCRARASALRI